MQQELEQLEASWRAEEARRASLRQPEATAVERQLRVLESRSAARRAALAERDRRAFERAEQASRSRSAGRRAALERNERAIREREERVNRSSRELRDARRRADRRRADFERNERAIIEAERRALTARRRALRVRFELRERAAVERDLQGFASERSARFARTEERHRARMAQELQEVVSRWARRAAGEAPPRPVPPQGFRARVEAVELYWRAAAQSGERLNTSALARALGIDVSSAREAVRHLTLRELIQDILLRREVQGGPPPDAAELARTLSARRNEVERVLRDLRNPPQADQQAMSMVERTPLLATPPTDGRRLAVVLGIPPMAGNGPLALGLAGFAVDHVDVPGPAGFAWTTLDTAIPALQATPAQEMSAEMSPAMEAAMTVGRIAGVAAVLVTIAYGIWTLTTSAATVACPVCGLMFVPTGPPGPIPGPTPA